MNSNFFQLLMEKDSIFKQFLKKLESIAHLSEKYKQTLAYLFFNYMSMLRKHNIALEPPLQLFDTFLELLNKQIEDPFIFEPYHQQITTPFDYYHFGLEFIQPIVDWDHSSVSGLEELNKIVSYLEKKENVIFLSNHQTEADPQLLLLMLNKTHPLLAKNMIFVAGERVITDPLTIPFSLGLNLLCIYSKRYIDQPPELKVNKQLHNKRTMEMMSHLLKEGGKSIWVAPSGGRDRRNAAGVVEVAPFDPQSLEMFYLMTQKSNRPTHFFPLILATYDLLPPPETIQVELGEERFVQRNSIHIAFGEEISMDHFPGCENKEKHQRRKLRAEHIDNIVKKKYSCFKL